MDRDDIEMEIARHSAVMAGAISELRGSWPSALEDLEQILIDMIDGKPIWPGALAEMDRKLYRSYDALRRLDALASEIRSFHRTVIFAIDAGGA